jgi:hypothetical protein
MTKRLTTLYAWLLLVIFGGIVIHAPLSVAIGTAWPQMALWIKSWKELMMLVALGLGVIIITRRHLWRELFDDWVIRLIAVYVALHLLLSIVMPHTTAMILAGLAIDLRYIAFFGLIYVLLRVAPEWRTPFLKVGAVGAVIVIGFAALQTVLPKDLLTHIGYSKTTIVPYLTVDQNPDFIRFGSTLRGPNPLGAYAVIVLAFAASLLLRQKLAIRRHKIQVLTGLIVVCSVVALWVSYSRSAGIAVVIALGTVAALARSWRLSRRGWFVLGSLVVIVALVGLSVWHSSFVSNVVLHENPNGGGSVSSNDGHAQSLQVGMERLIVQPVGSGIGTTGSASLYGGNGLIIENQYLFVAHETGWLGLVLFTAIFVLIMVRLYRRRADWLALGVFASGLGMAVIGLLLPVWVDDTVSIVWWGLAALALGATSHER